MTAPFTFQTEARSPRTVAVLIVVYAVLIGLVIVVDAAIWLMAILALVTVPALLDLWRNPSAGVTLDDAQLRWHSGRREGALDLDEIAHMRFDTRWDFSVRVAAVLPDDKRIRLPYEALPPHKTFEAALEARGLRVERHHFTIF